MKTGAVGIPIAPRLLKPNGDPDDVVEEATTLEIVALKPGGDLVTWTAALHPSGDTGRILYTTQAGDLDEHGRWRLEIVVTTPSGVFASKTFDMVVQARLQAAG